MKCYNVGDWLNIPDNIGRFAGFVYRIDEISTGKKYFGIKKFWTIIKYPPLKGKKNKRHKKVESDWKTYNTSNSYLQKQLKENPENYKKVIVKWCESIEEMKAWETYYQLEYYIKGDWNILFNEVVNLRLRIRKKGGKKNDRI